MNQYRKPNKDQRFHGINLPLYVIRIFRRAGINSGDALKEIYKREPSAIFSLRGVGNKTRSLIIDELGIPKGAEHQKCRVCGCDQEHACKGGCFWVYDDLCSQCYERMMSFIINFCEVEIVNNESYTEISERSVLAEDLESFDKAEGFLYGYIEGKGGYQYIDDSDTEPGKIYRMFEICSEANLDEVIYFFEKVTS